MDIKSCVILLVVCHISITIGQNENHETIKRKKDHRLLGVYKWFGIRSWKECLRCLLYTKFSSGKYDGIEEEDFVCNCRSNDGDFNEWGGGGEIVLPPSTSTSSTTTTSTSSTTSTTSTTTTSTTTTTTSTTTTTAPPPTPIHCSVTHDTKTVIDGHTYLYFSKQLDFTAAKAVCESCGCGAHLVVIETTTELNSLQAWLLSIGKSDIWVGLTKTAEPDTYTWINGAPLTIPFFRNTNSLNCGLYSSSPPNQVGLTTLSCSAHKDYVCETELPCIVP